MAATFALPGRRHARELMDTETVEIADYRACIADLEWVNRVSFGYRPTLDFVARMAKGRDRLTVLDLGSGHGDMLRAIWRAAQAKGLSVRLTGIDHDPRAAEAARAVTPSEAPIEYETADLFALDPARHFDLVVSALFAHHLMDDELLAFVALMERTAGLGWFINDLHRHALSEFGLRVMMPLAGLHRFVVHDGPISVRRAFVREDLERLLATAGIDPARADIRWWFPFRWGVTVRKVAA